MARGLSARSQHIISASYYILEEIQPATVRAVCYRLFVAKLIDNMSKGNTGKVGGLLVRAREEGLLVFSNPEMSLSDGRRI